MQTDHVESGSWFHGNGVFDSSGTEGYESYANVDLGFDLGLDGEHDWSDGTQFDLFDGFFFGGTGGTTQ